jgi:hypothetical protein
MWKIFSVPCGSTLYKFHCSMYHSETDKDNMEVDIIKMRWNGVDWIYLSQDRLLSTR